MTNQNEDPELIFQQAMQAYQSGQAEKAIDLLNQILKQIPDQDGIMVFSTRSDSNQQQIRKAK